MTWSAPKTWTPNEPIRSTDFNTYISDNLDYLLTRPVQKVAFTSDLTTTSTSFVDITGASITMNLKSDQALLLFSALIEAGPGTNTPNTFELRLVVNGGNERTWIRPGTGVMGAPGSAASPASRDVSLVYPLTGLTPGNNTVKLQWRHQGGGGSGTVRLYGTYGGEMVLLEI